MNIAQSITIDVITALLFFLILLFLLSGEPGWYATHWRFCQRGRVFGNQMWCAVHVVDNPDANAVLGSSVRVLGREKRSEKETKGPQEKVIPVSVMFCVYTVYVLGLIPLWFVLAYKLHKERSWAL